MRSRSNGVRRIIVLHEKDGCLTNSLLGLTTKELLAETAKTRTQVGTGDALGVLDAIFDGVQLQSMRCVFCQTCWLSDAQ